MDTIIMQNHDNRRLRLKIDVPERVRTNDMLCYSPAFYQLSYGGQANFARKKALYKLSALFRDDQISVVISQLVFYNS